MTNRFRKAISILSQPPVAILFPPTFSFVCACAQNVNTRACSGRNDVMNETCNGVGSKALGIFWIIILFNFVLYMQKNHSDIWRKRPCHSDHCAHMCVCWHSVCMRKQGRKLEETKWQLAVETKSTFPQSHGIYTERLSGLNPVRRLRCH